METLFPKWVKIISIPRSWEEDQEGSNWGVRGRFQTFSKYLLCFFNLVMIFVLFSNFKIRARGDPGQSYLWFWWHLILGGKLEIVFCQISSIIVKRTSTLHPFIFINILKLVDNITHNYKILWDKKRNRFRNITQNFGNIKSQ